MVPGGKSRSSQVAGSRIIPAKLSFAFVVRQVVVFLSRTLSLEVRMVFEVSELVV